MVQKRKAEDRLPTQAPYKGQRHSVWEVLGKGKAQYHSTMPTNMETVHDIFSSWYGASARSDTTKVETAKQLVRKNVFCHSQVSHMYAYGSSPVSYSLRLASILTIL